MATQLWHIQHINDTFSNLDTNLDDWQWGNITDENDLIGSMGDDGYISVYAGQYRTNDAGSTKTYIDAAFDDLRSYGDITAAEYIRRGGESGNNIRFTSGVMTLTSSTYLNLNGTMYVGPSGTVGIGQGPQAGADLAILSATPAIAFTDSTNNTDCTIETNSLGQIVYSADANDEQDGTYQAWWLDGSVAMTLDTTGLGIGTDSPQSLTDISDGTAYDNSWYNPGTNGAAILSPNSTLYLVGDDSGTWGSQIAFSQMDLSEATDIENVWGIARQTNGDGTGDGSLYITYGTGNNPAGNTATVSFSTAGHVSHLVDGTILKLGADSDVTLTHVHNLGILLNGGNYFSFRDSAIYINSINDGYMDFTADTGFRFNTGSVYFGNIAHDDATYTGILTSDSGVLKYRTKAEILSDIGAGTGDGDMYRDGATDGYISLNSGTNGIANSSMYQSGSSIGLNTVSPNAYFEIAGPAGPQLRLTDNTGAGDYCDFSVDDAGHTLINSSGGQLAIPGDKYLMLNGVDGDVYNRYVTASGRLDIYNANGDITIDCSCASGDLNLVPGGDVIISSGAGLRLGTAAAAGSVSANGTIAVKESDGTTIYLMYSTTAAA